MALKIVLLKFLALYAYILVFGAIMFAVENADYDEEEEKEKMSKMPEALQEMWEMVNIKYNMTKDEFLNITKIANEVQNPGRKLWSYWDGVHFAHSVCTTVGYGMITPTTTNGKLLCIFGALLGIPLTLLILNLVGSTMKDGFEKLIQWIEAKFLKRSSMRNVRLKCFLCTLAAMILIFAFGAFLVVRATSWSYFDAVYFLFISFSTIGFGDYVLYRDSKLRNFGYTTQIFLKTFSFVYMIFGLAVVAAVINSAMEVTQYLKCDAEMQVDDVKESRNTQTEVTAIDRL